MLFFQVYRENFPKTILEGKQATPGETRKVLFGTGLCIVIGIVVASFLRETGENTDFGVHFCYYCVPII